MNTELKKEYDTIQEILVKLYGLLDEAKNKGFEIIDSTF